MKQQLNSIGVGLTLMLYSLFLGTAVTAQNVTVRGWVTDTVKTGLPGVNVRAVNTNQMVNTDTSGKFTLSVPQKEVLEFSLVGHKLTQVVVSEFKPDNQGIVNVSVVLLPTDNNMDEIVVIGFGTQKRRSLVSSVTSVNVEDLKTPTGNLTNALAGRVAGMISFQTSGEPGIGTDNSQFYIRGLSTFGTGKRDPLILIDGVESSTTDMARVQPDDIADFSVLKDAAAAAVYGARGANGVVLINTKSGKSGVTKFDFRAENRVSTNTKNFDFADNITYMHLANEAALTRSPNAVQPYSINKINHTIAGDDPYLYPNNDWIGMLIKKYTLNQSYNLGLSGGNGKARYYVAGWYQLNNGNLKVDPVNDFNNNIKLQSYSLRINVNLNISPTTELIARVNGQFDDYKGPIGGGAASYRNAIWANPVMFPAVYPSEMLPYIEHPLFGSARMIASDGALTNTLYVNPYAEMVKGYSVTKTSNIMPQLEVKQNLKSVTPGLSAQAMAYVRRVSSFGINRSYLPFFYEPIVNPLDQTYTIRMLNHGEQGSVGAVGRETLSYDEGAKTLNAMIWAQGQLNYNRSFNKHDVGGMVISYLSSYESGNAGSVTSSLPQRNVGLSGRFSYGFDKRYMAEFNFGYNASERFEKNNRWGFFPSGGVAYAISNEKFFAPLLKVFNELKFRATYGIVGNDQIGSIGDRFFYMSQVNMSDAAYGASFGRNEGTGVYSKPGISVSRYANSKISWEISKQINLGIDAKMLDNSLDIVVDAFRQYRSNILMPRTYVESAAGFMATLISNYGKAESQGVDVAIGYNKQLYRNLSINPRGTFTYAASKLTVVDELIYGNDISYLSKVGQPISQVWGLIAERLFIDKNEVVNAPLQYGDAGLLAGDIKYRDVNGDGVVNDDDKVPIGLPTVPEIMFGLGSTIRYKKIDFNFFFQGSARSSFFINPQNIQPFFRNGGYENGLMRVIAEDHWSEDNPNLYAFWPRLSTWNVGSNNQISTWWMRKGDFVRLKSVDAGYSFDQLRKLKINSARLYFSATNLLLWSNFKMWDVEMGGSGLGYPIQSVYSLGLQVNF